MKLPREICIQIMVACRLSHFVEIWHYYGSTRYSTGDTRDDDGRNALYYNQVITLTVPKVW